METKNTLSDVLKRLVLDVDNMNSFLMSLENILESKSDNVSVTQTGSDGATTTINVPSFGYLKGKIEDINTRFETLLSTNSNVIGIKSANGEVRKFELKKTSQLLSELESIQNTSFTIPTAFGVKNNWFFESFLNPLLFVSLDISSILTDDIDSFVVKRIIINAVNNDDFATYFDTNYSGKNDIILEDLKTDLDAYLIDYFEDDNTVDVATAINRYTGTFDILRILEEEGTQTLTSGQSVSVLRRRYKLSTLNYTDVFTGTKNSKILAEGDVLITENDSEYIVRSVNKTDTEVVLERIFGIEPITIGAAILRIMPLPFRIPELQVNVGFNEREIIFIKPISKAKNLTVDNYSNGVAVFTNDLTISLADNTTTTLASYYNNFVSDFGLILLNFAKEKKLPAILGITPSAPTIDAANFSVVQIDQHLQDDKNVATINSTIKEKAATEKEIQELNKKIDEIKSNISTVSKTTQEAKRLQKQLTEVQKNRTEKTTTLSTLVTNLTLQLSNTPQFVNQKKYAVRGFWQVPIALTGTYGSQQVIQFKYRYRYLSQSGNQPNAQQQTFTDTDGTKKSATFSPWTEVLTKPKTKELDTTTGLYKWTTENLSDADQVNTNQLDIPIRKGEVIEFQIHSISEAGWPDNPVVSDWSNLVQISFPENITSQEESTVVSQKVFADKTRLDFEKSLIARGVDTHLANQFTTGERFFAHNAQDIASGFYTATGSVIDLFEQITTLKNTIESLQQAITQDRGVIKVSIVDPSGNLTDVVNGDTISLFAGYYRDLIKDTTGGTTVYNEGRIITKQYSISIQNTSATKLELVSLLFGGSDEIMTQSDPIANPDKDYHVNRRYDIVPIGVNKNQTPFLGDFKQIPSQQSGQVKSQYINSRARNYGLSEQLYTEVNDTTQYVTNPVYNYQGTLYNSVRIPYDWGHYLPYDPTYSTVGSSNTKVWNGAIISSIPQGGGYLSEFCISKDHPTLKSITSFTYSASALAALFAPDFASAVPPTIDATAKQVTLPFAQALHFEASVAEDTNKFGVKYYKQAVRKNLTSPTSNLSKTLDNYPIKLGFKPNDEYLIGKYTCGSYFYMFPLNYNAISVEGNFPTRSTKAISFGADNALNIPVLFQFRCSDKLGYIGGYRSNETLNNIKYQKKIGIDIIVKDDVPFSFDLEVSAQYTKETSLDAPIVQSKGTVTTF